MDSSAKVHKREPQGRNLIPILIPIVLTSVSGRVWLTTHMMTSPQSQVAAVSAYASPGGTGMIHYTVKSSLY